MAEWPNAAVLKTVASQGALGSNPSLSVFSMGQIRKVGDTYYIEFYARGLLYSQVAGPDPVAALKLLEATEAKISGGEALTIVREIDLAVFFEQFVVYARGEFSLKSIDRFTRVIAHFTGFLKTAYPRVILLSRITPSVIENYKAFLVVSAKPRLINFTILLLREILEYGIKLRFINDNPTLHVRLLLLPARNRPSTRRYEAARQLFAQGISLGKICKLLQLSDIARIMYYRDLIPLSREDLRI